MSLRQRTWARKTRDTLRLELGGKCVKCGTTEDLEFDCKKPMGSFHHRAMCWSWRMSFYRAQHALNNLQLLCKSCNCRKAGHELEQDWLAPLATPF